MRIIFVNSGLRYGGAETQLIALMTELRRQGHEVALYLLTRDAPRLDDVLALDIPVFVDEKKAKFDVGVLRRLRAFILTWRPDVVHAFLFDANVYSRVAAMGTGVPVLNSERSSAYTLRLSQWAAHMPTRWLTSGVVANSYAGAALARKLYALPFDRVDVVWNGVDFEALQIRANQDGKDYRREFFDDDNVWIAVLIGTISYQKDYLLALEVASQLSKRDLRWRILFVGASFGEQLKYANATASLSTSYESKVMAKFESLGIENSVHFAGQRKDALGIVASSDVLFSTSAAEGFPNVVLEAMVLGTPVVATEFSDIRRILPQPWQVVASRDAGELADAICRAKEQRESLVEEQRLWARQHCSIEGAVGRLLGIYAKYIQMPGAKLGQARRGS